MIGGVFDPAVICVAPNGARRTQEDHAGLPLSANELAREACLCRDAGAAMMHLHVRDGEGRHVLDADVYRDVLGTIRREVGRDMILQITTEAVGRYRPVHQMAVVEAVRPQSASLAIGELIPAGEETLADFFTWMDAHDVLAQYILYSSQDVRHFNALRERGLIVEARPFVLFVLGSHGPKIGTVDDLNDRVDALVEGGPVHWGVCAFGEREAPAAAAALMMGGHPRLGFENNLYLESGALAPNNAALVRQTVRAAALEERVIADANAAHAVFAMDCPQGRGGIVGGEKRA